MKWFWPITVVLLAGMGAVQIVSVRQESQTWDEGIHLAAGYRYWKTGDLSFNSEHPPLGKYLNALPLLWMHPQLPAADTPDPIEYSRQFLYRNRIGADRMLFAARLVTIGLSLCFGLLLLLWTRRKFGEAVALFALALFTFDPNLIAHGRYVTSDLLVAFLFFLSCAVWSEYLSTRRGLWMVLAGVALGLAIGSKFSAVILIPIFIVLAMFHWRGVKPLLCVCALAAMIVVALYAPQARTFIPGIRLFDRSVPPARQNIHTESALGRSLLKTTNILALGRNSFFEGLSAVAMKNAIGHDAYLLGRQSKTGWWYYFPVVMLVKSPAGLLLGLAAAVWFAIRSRPAHWQVLTIPPAIYFAACIVSHINLGVRHLLPIYPFLCIFIAATLWPARRAILIVATSLVIVESIAIFPYYTAFFNVVSGGPGKGPRYLVDSNIDWGQDLRRLKTYLDQQGEKGACLLYFGAALPEYYGIGYDGPPTPDQNCLAAVSVTPLMGMYVPDDPMAWLRERKPVAKIGYSIYIYDLHRSSTRTLPAK